MKIDKTIKAIKTVLARTEFPLGELNAFWVCPKCH